MKIFKDTNNQVHEIEEGFEHFLPSDAVEITQAEADALRAPTEEELFAQAKVSKLAELEEVYLAKIQAIDEDLTTEGLAVLEILWLSIASAARNPNADMVQLIDLHQARKAIIAEARLLTTSTELLAYDVATNVLWPVEA